MIMFATMNIAHQQQKDVDDDVRGLSTFYTKDTSFYVFKPGILNSFPMPILAGRVDQQGRHQATHLCLLCLLQLQPSCFLLMHVTQLLLCLTQKTRPEDACQPFTAHALGKPCFSLQQNTALRNEHQHQHPRLLW